MKFDIESLQDLAALHAKGVCTFPRRAGNTTLRMHQLVQSMIVNDGKSNGVFVCRSVYDIDRMMDLAIDVLSHYEINYRLGVKHEVFTNIGIISFKSINNGLGYTRPETIVEYDYNLPRRINWVERMFIDDLEDNNA